MRRPLIVALLAAAAAVAWLVLTRMAPTPPVSQPAGSEHPQGHTDDPLTLVGSADQPAKPASSSQERAGDPTPVVAIGTVVDEHYRPVAGAEIVATIRGAETGRTRTAADGRFAVPLLPPASDVLLGALAAHEGARGAWRSVHVGPDAQGRVDCGRIVLQGLGALTVRVVRQGVPVVGADVVVGEAAAHARLALQSARSDAEGRARFEGVPGRKVGVWAVATGSGRGYREVHLPTVDIVELELPADRTATILVKHGTTGEPIEDAEVSLAGGGTLPVPMGAGCLPPLPALRTGKDGRVSVSGLPAGHLWVVARTPQLAMRNHGLMVERVMLAPDGSEATVVLWPYRSVRFPITEAGAGAPPDGTPLEMSRYQPLIGYDVGQPRARVEAGHLVLEAFPPGGDWGHVTAPDGRWALWKAPLDQDLGEPVEFRRIHDLRIRLQFRDGTPAAGEYVSASVRPRGSRTPTRTDAHGEVVFERCIGESAHIRWTPVEGGFGAPLGSVGLVSDPGLVTFTIDPPVEILLRILGGRDARIPAGIEVYVPDLDPAGRGGDRQVVPAELSMSSETAEVGFRWLPMPGGDAPPVKLRATGVPDVVAMPRRSADGVWRADVDLVAGGTLLARVTVPEGARYFLKLERWDEPTGTWVYLHDHPGYQAARSAVDGVHRIGGLAQGRYRLTDHYTARSSDPVEIRPGDTVDAHLDLTSTVLVRGRVELPSGEDPTYVTVHVAGREAGSVSESNPAHVTREGTFELRAKRGERLSLVGRHPFLRLAPGPVTCVAGGDEPLLRFAPGPHVVFRIHGSDLTTAEPNPSASPSWWSPVHVRVWKSGSQDGHGVSRPAMARSGVFRAGVPAPGTWSVRIEQHGFVPLDLESVELGPEATDLGTLRPSEGATLLVRIFPGAQGLPQDVSVQAERQGPRPYTAWGSKISAGDPPTATLKGLGAGSFRVVVRENAGQGDPLGEALVASDGTGRLSVDIRLP